MPNVRNSHGYRDLAVVVSVKLLSLIRWGEVEKKHADSSYDGDFEKCKEMNILHLIIFPRVNRGVKYANCIWHE